MTAASVTEGQSDNLPRSAVGRLSERVQGLRTRATPEQLERMLLVVGGVLMPLGALLILLGWLGASRTPLVYEQNDYLISDGLGGLALVVAGGFTYFSYWQTVRIRESRQQASELTNAVARLGMLLRDGAMAAGPGVSATPLVATARGSMFHRRDCSMVAGRADLRPVDEQQTSLRPCRVCHPAASRE